MWQIILLMLRRQPGKSALVSSGFLIAACALLLLSATTQTTVAVGNQIISQSWRSSYDLVVLPPQVQLPSRTLLPADLLAGYDGGISFQQYQQIQHIPGVDIAAPLAYIGYVQMPVPHVVFSPQALAPGYYRLDWTLSAFNGQHTIVERKETTYYYHPPNCDANHPPTKVGDALFKQGVALDCTSSDVPWSEFSSVDSGTFLLAAIDPTAENQLVHLNQSVSSGRMLSPQDGIQLNSDPTLGHVLSCPKGQALYGSNCKRIPNYDIPVLFHTQVPGQITLRGNFTRIASATLDPKTVLAHGGAAYLSHLSALQTLFDGVVPLVQNDPQRFSTGEILWDGHSWQPFVPFFGKNPNYYAIKFLYRPSGLTYQSTTPPPGQAGAAYVVLPNGVQEPEAAFRQLHPLSIAQGATSYTPQAFYFFQFIGHFAGDTLATQFSNPLNWLPESTYTSPSTILRYDAQGHPVNPTNVLPTTNPAGFTLQPPLALTTLSVAQRLRGNTALSAIRIRVTGVDAANPASWKRIQEVAGAIEQQTHLRALVTLGSSPRPTLVYVPGVSQGQFGAHQAIAPLGWVEERWIAVGVSLLYLAQLGTTRLLLIGTVFAVCLGYLMVSFRALVTAQRTDLAILSALGWRPWHPVRLFLTQALSLALIGGVTGIGIALLLAALLHVTPLLLLVIWTLPVILVLALVSALSPLWLLWHLRPSEILRTGTPLMRTSRLSRGLSLGLARWLVLLPTGGMVMRNLSRVPSRTVLTIISLLLSTLLIVLMVSSILTLRQTLTGTLLGDYVLLQTAVPQLAGCLFAMLLSFLSVANLLLLQVQERRREIGLLQALGWRMGLIQRMFVQEGMTIALLGALPGAIIAGAILLQQAGQPLLPLILVAGGTVILLLLVIALATLPVLRAVQRMQPSELLRTE